LGLIAQPRNLALLNGIAQIDFAEMKEVSIFLPYALGPLQLGTPRYKYLHWLVLNLSII